MITCMKLPCSTTSYYTDGAKLLSPNMLLNNPCAAILRSITFVTSVMFLSFLNICYNPAFADSNFSTEHPVGEIRCEILPAAATPEVAKFYKDTLEVLEVCPAGYYPHRYGTGKDLHSFEKCIPDNAPILRADPIDLNEPVVDLQEADAVAKYVQEVSICPSHTNLKIYGNSNSSFQKEPPTAKLGFKGSE